MVCIDSATGRRFKTVPIEGVIEAIHSTGAGAESWGVVVLEARVYLGGSVSCLDLAHYQQQWGLNREGRGSGRTELHCSLLYGAPMP